MVGVWHSFHHRLRRSVQGLVIYHLFTQIAQMKLENHIVNRLLLDDTLWTEMVITQGESDGLTLNEMAAGNVDNYVNMYDLVNSKGNKTYYVTKSVVDRMDLLDTKKCMTIEGWKIFNTLPDFKKTFILPDHANLHDSSRCLRVQKIGGLLYFCHLSFKMHEKARRKPGDDGLLNWVLLYVDLDQNQLCTHLQSEDGKALAPFLYALMCYVELCENEEVIVQPKAKYGTQKSGKLINILPFPITVINNTWNITTVRAEGFPVCGHSAIYWTGIGRTTPKLVYIEPYMKSGYTRKSGKQLQPTS